MCVIQHAVGLVSSARCVSAALVSRAYDLLCTHVAAPAIFLLQAFKYKAVVQPSICVVLTCMLYSFCKLKQHELAAAL